MDATIATINKIATVQNGAQEGAPTLKLRLRQEPTLKDLCSEHIKDNFFFGIYGDASSPETCFRLVIDKNTGFFDERASPVRRGSASRYRPMQPRCVKREERSIANGLVLKSQRR